LERKLLVHAAEIHTDSGAHAKLLESWEHWQEGLASHRTFISVDDAKKKMEAKTSEIK